jgi:hypothetical protein
VRKLLSLLGSTVLIFTLPGCSQSVSTASGHDDPAGPQWFKDITEEVGLDFVHDAGPVGSYFMPQIVGSGAAFFDFDNDGRLDIYLLQNGGPNSQSTNRLFHQGPDGRFTDVSKGSGLDIAGYCMGVAIGDVNNDGWPDVLVTEYRGIKLFLNNGNGTFTDVTAEAGLENLLWGTSAAFLDYDRDGWLDLVVTNYVDFDPSSNCALAKQDFCQPFDFEGTVTKLFHNLGPASRVASARPFGSPGVRAKGNRVRFEDVTLKSGLGRSPGAGLGVVCADFNGDGWPDILVANDAKRNHLWINQHDGTFKEEGLIYGVAYNGRGQVQANMGIAIGDVNGDGEFDVFITHLTEELHVLYQQGPRGTFLDRTGPSRLANPKWRGTGFGTVLVDFDHDGAVDLAIVNGRVARGRRADNPSPGAYAHRRAVVPMPVSSTLDGHGQRRSMYSWPGWSDYAERNQLFVNDGTGKFTDISPHNAEFCGEAMISRGLACGDIDGDGAMDLLVTTVAAPARLYRNIAPKRGHWLLVRAIDPALRRDAYGATITVQAGERRWVSWVNPGQSFLCSNDPRAHFGLGPADRVDRIQVLWPDGVKEVFPGRRADQEIVLRRGQGRKE